MNTDQPERDRAPVRPAPALIWHVLDTGYCLAAENHLVTTGARARVPVHSVAILLRHPAHGWFLFDTGYAPRILEVTLGYPFRAYRWATPMTVSAELAVVEQLGRFGLKREDVRLIVVSHFHGDHVAGLRDFPAARLIAGREAWIGVRELSSVGALARGFLPGLIPGDFDQRATLVGEFAGPEVGAFGGSYDIFADGSALLVRLPGHAKGQLGMMVHTADGGVLFAADSCYVLASIRDRVFPHPVTRIFTDDWSAMKATIHKLADFAAAHPEVTIVPTHCPEAMRMAMAGRA